MASNDDAPAVATFRNYIPPADDAVSESPVEEIAEASIVDAPVTVTPPEAAEIVPPKPASRAGKKEN